MDLSLDNIADAAHAVDPVFLNTPQFFDPALTKHFGRQVLVKVETLNPLRSFKGRGADYFVRTLRPGHEVVCGSAGNFGQAIAYTAGRRGLPVLVFAAETANPAKVERMRELGAEVVLHGADFDEAKAAGRTYAEKRGQIFVEDGHEPLISEGAGTIGLELTGAGGDTLDTLLVPVGNGALISGVARWLKARSPRTRVVGVCPAGAPSMERSWRSGTAVATERIDTIADGLAVRVPVPAAVDWMRSYVDDMLLVDDEAIYAALLVLRDCTGLIAEPSAVAGLAALATHEIAGEKVGTILTGANFGPDLLRRLTSRIP
ncbi:threonine ammonia-lyase [Fodinicola acaciae]|uniref:threonine ammonia-lyase n=1 Tax=Fodinicola acaciae TaxID=2681555 RepID=UPI001C9E91F6|nr:threonine/serine dehydratase [Fodinicola acaciae]